MNQWDEDEEEVEPPEYLKQVAQKLGTQVFFLGSHREGGCEWSIPLDPERRGTHRLTFCSFYGDTWVCHLTRWGQGYASTPPLDDDVGRATPQEAFEALGLGYEESLERWGEMCQKLRAAV